MSVYSGVAVVVQARLNSSRLPRKALLNLCGKPLLAYTLEAMREIPAERYILACDRASAADFAPIAEQFHYTLISGSETDVLGRFCSVIRQFETSLRPITTIIRATGDNPFLFTEAAEASVKRFVELGEPDYFTFTGLPHGSGVEIIKAKSLLTAERLTDDAYDHEHVGPALYRHTDTFICVKETAPLQWYAPHLRTTVDTQDDFECAELMMQYLQREKAVMPPSASAVMKACRYAGRIAVFVPSVREGQGTGHLRRACSLMQELAPQLRSVLYLGAASEPSFVQAIIKKIGNIETVNEIPEQTCVFILDNFRTQAEEVRQLKKIAPVVALDEGGEGRAFVDYLIDILPALPHPIELSDVSVPKPSSDSSSASNSSQPSRNRTADHSERIPDYSESVEAFRANLTEVNFIALPQKRKRDGALKKYEKTGNTFFPLKMQSS
ncbi:cytidylyltransferase domain-containing protein [Treponema sp. OMZ 838]|uniref:cytidylyltransferase domain-containing protein n=1 Tax=Treponema sp. OMZ 838 TaxID=1539298 RepID=UPI000AAF699A|nr:hypothetical protein [Treponema sp. OMZ 838]